MTPDWSTFHFGSPWQLMLVAPVVVMLWLSGRPGVAPALLISSVALVGERARPPRARGGWQRDGLRCGVLALVVVALARPQLDRAVQPEPARAIDVMMLVDASRSMDTPDFESGQEKISRMEALRRVVGNFVKARPQDRIGVIGFAEKPYLICPLTLDHSWMMESLGQAQTALGTAIGSSIEAGVDLLRAGGNESRILILITDGINTSGADPLAAAKVAAAEGIRLYAIEAVSYDHIQTEGLEQHPLYAMARLTGGSFFQAGSSEALQDVYRQIDQLERMQVPHTRSRDFIPLFGWFAGCAALLVAVESVMRSSRWLRVP